MATTSYRKCRNIQPFTGRLCPNYDSIFLKKQWSPGPGGHLKSLPHPWNPFAVSVRMWEQAVGPRLNSPGCSAEQANLTAYKSYLQWKRVCLMKCYGLLINYYIPLFHRSVNEVKWENIYERPSETLKVLSNPTVLEVKLNSFSFSVQI